MSSVQLTGEGMDGVVCYRCSKHTFSVTLNDFPIGWVRSGIVGWMASSYDGAPIEECDTPRAAAVAVVSACKNALSDQMARGGLEPPANSECDHCGASSSGSSWPVICEHCLEVRQGCNFTNEKLHQILCDRSQVLELHPQIINDLVGTVSYLQSQLQKEVGRR